MSGDTGLSQQLCDFDLDDNGGVELTDQEAEEGARAYDEAQRLVCQYSHKPRTQPKPMNASSLAKLSLNPRQAAVAEETPMVNSLKKVANSAQIPQPRTQFCFACCSVVCLACVQDETMICTDFELCKKTPGCTRKCEIGKTHVGVCSCDGKALKADKMDTDEPGWLKDASDRVLRPQDTPTDKGDVLTSCARSPSARDGATRLPSPRLSAANTNGREAQVELLRRTPV